MLTYIDQSFAPGVEQPGRVERCHDCGAAAAFIIVADQLDAETGYLDSLALCTPCADRRDAAEREAQR